MSLQQNDANSIICPDCGREWDNTEGLSVGDSCPSDDCPSSSSNFELIVAGFDGGTDETDNNVIWVSAKNRESLQQLIDENNLSGVLSFGDVLPKEYTKDDGIDFDLPGDLVEFKERVLRVNA